MPPSDKSEQESSDEGILGCEKNFRTSATLRVAVLRISVKWTRKFKKYSKHQPPPPKKKSKTLITSQNSTSVPAWIQSEVSSSENQ